MTERKNNLSKLFCILFLIYAIVISVLPSIFQLIPYFAIPIALAFTVLVFYLSRKCADKSTAQSESSKKENIIWFVVSFAATATVLLAYYFCVFEKDVTPDIENQFNQALTGTYNDWHPVMHTVLFYTVPMIFSKSMTFLVCWQIALFSLSHSYLIYTMRKNNCSRLLCAIELIIAINPSLYRAIVIVLKDCGMAIFCILLVSQCINIMCSDGKWLDKKINIAAFAITLALATLMRHNAVLFTLPLVLMLFVFMKKSRKQIIISAVCFILILGIIKIPVFRAMKVEKPDQRVTETTGICMAVMGNVLVNDSESLEPEIKEFLYEVSPKDIWEKNYTTGNFNSVKFHPETKEKLIDELGYAGVLSYTAKCVAASPWYSLQAFVNLTGTVWNIFYTYNDNEVYVYSLYDLTNLYDVIGICLSGIKIPDTAKLFLSNIYTIGFGIGTVDFILIALAACMIKKKNQIKMLMFIAPVLCYNFGTALLLTGFDLRFFFYTFYVFVPIIFLMVRENCNSIGKKTL